MFYFLSNHGKLGKFFFQITLREEIVCGKRGCKRKNYMDSIEMST